MRWFKLKLIFPTLLGLPILAVSCGHDYDQLVKNVERSSPEQWHKWAEQLIASSKTNATAVLISQWPPFVRDVTKGIYGGWELYVQTNVSVGEPYVMLVSPGGFQGIGVDFGSPSFVEASPSGREYNVTRILRESMCVGARNSFANNSMLRTGTRLGLCRTLDFGHWLSPVPGAEFQVPVADFGRSA